MNKKFKNKSPIKKPTKFKLKEIPKFSKKSHAKQYKQKKIILNKTQFIN